MEDLAAGRLFPDGTDHLAMAAETIAAETIAAEAIAAEAMAAEDLSGMEAKIAAAEPPATGPSAEEKPDGVTAAPGGAAMETAMHLRAAQERQAEGHRRYTASRDRRPVYRLRSDVAPDAPVPTPPFFGSKIVTDVAIEKIYEYINEVALVRGQWQFRRGKRSETEYRHELETVVGPRHEALKLQLKREPGGGVRVFPLSVRGR